MNIVVIVLIIAVLCWNAIYTVSYGIWTIKDKNIKGGIALLLLALASVSIPLYLLWKRM
ncbi:MAG: hypothetical protein GX211_02570 [Clostridiaceae bacterium]|jgi:hypothetical protein|nr:hypothetical protein [Clostridiaceae bacterium]